MIALKKTLIFLIGILLLIFTVYTLLFKNKNVIPEEKVDLRIPIITGVVGVGGNFVFNLPSNIALPKKVSYITRENPKPFSENDIQTIRESLSFSKDPTILNDVTFGKTYLYKETSMSLTVYSDARVIIFSQKTPTSPKKLISDEEYINIAESFFSLLKLKNKYKFSYFNYLLYEPFNEQNTTTTRDKANTIRANFSISNEDVKILTRSPKSSLATITMDIGGNISEAEIRDLGSFKFSNQEYELKEIEEIKNSTKQYILISLDNVYYPDFEEVKNEIMISTINNIELVYFYDYMERNILQPVFHLTGKAKLKEEDGEKNVSYYLPAFAQ